MNPLAMKFYLLLVLAAFGHGALLGSKKCTYGPSYWCSHISHARECGAMDHCITTVWKNQNLDMIGSSETCFDVLKVLDVVRQAHDGELADQWLVGCTGMPIQKRGPCKEMVKNDMNEVSKLLLSDLSSRQVAAALKLCGEFTDTVPHHDQESDKNVGRDYCTDCVNFASDLREIFNNSEGQAEAYIKKMVCSKAGAFQSLCDTLVDQYAAMIFSFVYDRLNPREICKDLRFCANMTNAKLFEGFKDILANKRQRGAAECDVCKNIAKDLQDLLRDPTLQSDMIAFVKNDVCTYLGSLTAQCQSYVDMYMPVVFQIVVAELDPPTFCQTLGLCNATIQIGGVWGTIQFEAPVPKQTDLRRQSPNRRTKQTDMECELCEKLVAFLEKEIEGKTAEELQAEMKKLCELLPSADEAECMSVVDKYGRIIMDLLLKEASPEEICKLAKLCTSKAKLHALSLEPSVKTSTKCEICELVIKEVKKELNSSGGQKAVEEILEEVCNVVPTGYKQLCDLFIEEYALSIINKVNQELNPAQICADVDLCGSSDAKALKFQPLTDLRPAKQHLVGTDKCLYGPSYWCASLDNAKRCNTVEHCKRLKMPGF